MRTSSKHLRNEKGVTMVEAAIILPLLFAITLAGIDLLRISFNWVSVQYLAERGMRQAVIASNDGQDVQNFLIQSAADLGLTLTNANIALCPLRPGPACFGTSDIGRPSGMLTLEIRIPVQGFLFGNTFLLPGALNLSASTQAVREHSA